MRKKRAVLLAGLLLIFLGVISWITLIPRDTEPLYQGKKLSYWLKDSLPEADVSLEELQRDRAAVREIGTNAIPTLLKWLSTEDGPIKKKLIVWIDEHPRVPFHVEPAMNKQIKAVGAFYILGPLQSASAVPGLVEIVKRGGGLIPPGAGTVTFPMMALAYLNHEAAVEAGVKFGTNGGITGWSAPTNEAKK